jgi:hypothetical protein
MQPLSGRSSQGFGADMNDISSVSAPKPKGGQKIEFGGAVWGGLWLGCRQTRGPSRFVAAHQRDAMCRKLGTIPVASVVSSRQEASCVDRGYQS